jgi:ElaB/YqjD/DUF883 family membrane-anchored ribosome-binding protein
VIVPVHVWSIRCEPAAFSRARRIAFPPVGTIPIPTRLKNRVTERNGKMAEKKLAAVGLEPDTEKQPTQTQVELETQIAELRAEISRLTDTVTAIGSGAKAVVQGEAELMAERVRERVREEPISTLLTVAGVAFLFGLLARR